MSALQTVLDALRARKERFVFEDIEVTLKSTVMAFITMNPGYPGRAELPESLKVNASLAGIPLLSLHNLRICCSVLHCEFARPIDSVHSLLHVTCTTIRVWLIVKSGALCTQASMDC